MFLALFGLVVVAPAASAAHVSCGSTILVSTVLDTDLNCPTAGVPAITIGADNVTFDLGGHTISGPGIVSDHAGVFVPGRTGVTVQNGTVTGFASGVAIQQGSGNRVLNMRTVNNIGSGRTSHGAGIFLDRSHDNLVRGNLVQGNGPFGGIRVVIGSGNTIDRNSVVQNNRDPSNTSGIGLWNQGGTCNSSNFNVVTNNFVQQSATFGIQVFACSTGNVVRFNRSIGNRLDGIVVHAGSFRNIVESNAAQLNGRHGIFLQGPAGVFPQGTHDNQVLRNQASQNGQDPSLGAGFDLRDGNNNCTNNQWHGNQGVTANPPCTLQP